MRKIVSNIGYQTSNTVQLYRGKLPFSGGLRPLNRNPLLRPRARCGFDSQSL